ncbi:hypothetical protein EDD21DRAFT_215017 [Dissophora ornata]|nr:hypothetical protein EDD21DRAFT_215017 [Dissophora ornata]
MCVNVWRMECVQRRGCVVIVCLCADMHAYVLCVRMGDRPGGWTMLAQFTQSTIDNRQQTTNRQCTLLPAPPRVGQTHFVGVPPIEFPRFLSQTDRLAEQPAHRLRETQNGRAVLPRRSHWR